MNKCLISEKKLVQMQDFKILNYSSIWHSLHGLPEELSSMSQFQFNQDCLPACPSPRYFIQGIQKITVHHTICVLWLSALLLFEHPVQLFPLSLKLVISELMFKYLMYLSKFSMYFKQILVKIRKKFDIIGRFSNAFRQVSNIFGQTSTVLSKIKILPN